MGKGNVGVQESLQHFSLDRMSTWRGGQIPKAQSTQLPSTSYSQWVNGPGDQFKVLKLSFNDSFWRNVYSIFCSFPIKLLLLIKYVNNNSLFNL